MYFFDRVKHKMKIDPEWVTRLKGDKHFKQKKMCPKCGVHFKEIKRHLGKCMY